MLHAPIPPGKSLVIAAESNNLPKRCVAERATASQGKPDTTVTGSRQRRLAPIRNPVESRTMSADKPLMTQLVELLGISQAAAWPLGIEEVVIITVRPQPNSFHPHNIALKKGQAIRLLKDLESLLRPTVVVLVAFLAVVAVGCSARVEVERTNDTTATATEISSTEIGRTAVEVDLHPRSPQPVSQPQPPPVTTTVAPEQKPTTVTNNTLIFNYQGGDVTYNWDVHVNVPEPVEETVVIRREVHSVPPRPVDPRCEQSRREHDERVRRWKAFPLGQ